MFRKWFYGLSLVFSLCPFISHADDIEATLSTSDSSSGFAVKNSGGSTVFKVAGDGSLTLATSIGASYFATEARQTQRIETTTKTSDTVVTSSDGVILADPSGGAFTVTLPTASGFAGRTHTVVMSGGGPTVTIAGNGSETIDGAANTTLSSTGTSLTVISDGSGWHSLSIATTTSSSTSNSTGRSYGQTTIVAASGGNYTSPNDAVTNIATWCGTPSSSNPCFIYIMPGYYTLTATLDLSSYSYVSVVGSGQKATFVEMANDVILKTANESEIRDMTFIGSGTSALKYGIHNNGTAVRITDTTVKMTSTGSATHAIYTQNSTAALTANSVTISTKGTAHGIFNSNVGGSIMLNNLHINAKGNSGFGILEAGSGPILIKNSMIATTGSSGTAAKFAGSSSRIVVRDSSFTSGKADALLLELSSGSSQLRLDNVHMASYGSSTYGLNAKSSDSAVTVKIQDSRLYAPSSTALYVNDADFTLHVGNTLIDGNSPINQNNTSATLNCFHIYNSSFSAITGTSASTCDTNNN